MGLREALHPVGMIPTTFEYPFLCALYTFESPYISLDEKNKKEGKRKKRERKRGTWVIDDVHAHAVDGGLARVYREY